ncbi:hypothetical protein MRX96_005310 [Rhipicephalus microplus]
MALGARVLETPGAPRAREHSSGTRTQSLPTTTCPQPPEQNGVHWEGQERGEKEEEGRGEGASGADSHKSRLPGDLFKYVSTRILRRAEPARSRSLPPLCLPQSVN